MKVSLPQYNGKDNLVMILVMPVFALIVNALIFGWRYFTSWKLFLVATLITGLTACIYFVLCGVVAVALKKRFPEEEQVMRRLSLMIMTFLILGGLILYLLFRAYERISFFNCEFDDAAFVWAYFALGALNIFITFLMEGISRYNAWEKNRTEAENLNRVYKQSQLQGLKSQVNSHFLFNSLNSLSTLIQDDEEGAEIFLNEMSKVYRYLLRNDEEQLVTLATELKFVNAYMHLLKARFRNGLQLAIDVNENDQEKLLAPLTLQVIIENTFSQNITSYHSPLFISIFSNGQGELIIQNNVQPKTITGAIDFEAGLDNLVKKYQLLNQPVSISDANQEHRYIRIRLFSKMEETRP